MKLREWDWDAQNYVEIDYPDEPIKAFVDWLRNNRQWRESPDPGRDVYTRFRRLEDELAAHRVKLREERLKATEQAPRGGGRKRATSTKKNDAAPAAA